jgi:hypothetical protein
MKIRNSSRWETIFFVLLVTALVGAGCAPAPTPEETSEKISVSMSTELNASAADVWKVVGDFGGIDFLSAIASVSVEGEGLGSIRTLTLAGEEGGTIMERLEALDNEGMTLTYSILESQLPIDHNTGTMTVSESEEGKTTFTWSSTFAARGISDEEAKAFVENFYMGGFADLQKLFGGKESGTDKE